MLMICKWQCITFANGHATHMKNGIFILLFVFSAHCYAQSQAMNLALCEQRFLEKNLLLLAGQYNVNAAEALVVQAKAWPNPVFNADVNVYDPQNHRYFHVDSSGQKSFQLEQVIVLGGKRRTEIEIAKQNQVLAASELADLLRNLRVQLVSSFYGISSASALIGNYNRQLTILDTIIRNYSQQTAKGNIPTKELVRLKSVYIKISANRAETSADLNEQQKRLQLLLGLSQPVVPLTDSLSYNRFLAQKSIDDLQTMALAQRPDLNIAGQSAAIAALQLELEKKQRIPDISLNASYDQRGGAFRNQVNAGLSIPLPVFNTNRGRIRAARYDKDAQALYLEQKKLEVELETRQAWENLQRNQTEYARISSFFDADFRQVDNGIYTNFQKRNISILEFVDHVEAYNESLADLERVKLQLALSAAMINYVTATPVY